MKFTLTRTCTVAVRVWIYNSRKGKKYIQICSTRLFILTDNFYCLKCILTVKYCEGKILRTTKGQTDRWTNFKKIHVTCAHTSLSARQSLRKCSYRLNAIHHFTKCHLEKYGLQTRFDSLDIWDLKFTKCVTGTTI